MYASRNNVDEYNLMEEGADRPSEKYLVGIGWLISLPIVFASLFGLFAYSSWKLEGMSDAQAKTYSKDFFKYGQLIFAACICLPTFAAVFVRFFSSIVRPYYDPNTTPHPRARIKGKALIVLQIFSVLCVSWLFAGGLVCVASKKDEHAFAGCFTHVPREDVDIDELLATMGKNAFATGVMGMYLFLSGGFPVNKSKISGFLRGLCSFGCGKGTFGGDLDFDAGTQQHDNEQGNRTEQDNIPVAAANYFNGNNRA